MYTHSRVGAMSSTPTCIAPGALSPSSHQCLRLRNGYQHRQTVEPPLLSAGHPVPSFGSEARSCAPRVRACLCACTCMSVRSCRNGHFFPFVFQTTAGDNTARLMTSRNRYSFARPEYEAALLFLVLLAAACHVGKAGLLASNAFFTDSRSRSAPNSTS